MNVMTFFNFLFILLFAHQDLPDTTCTLAQQKDKIVVNKGQGTDYNIQLPKHSKPLIFKKPKIKDFFDPKLKQLFDTYSFSQNSVHVVFKRPETKGPVKNLVAEYLGNSYTCQ